MIAGLHLLALAAYLAAWALQLQAFREAEPPDGIPGGRAAVAGVIVHLVGLITFWAVHGELPLLGLGPASSSLAFLIALFALAAQGWYGVRSVGLFLLPMVVLLLGEATWVGLDPAAHQTAFRGPWFAVHVGAVFLGYAGLALGSVAALMYVLQFRALKQKSFGSVFRVFPSLEALDRLNLLGLGVGLPALTVGIVAGWGWSLTYGPGFDLGNPQVIFGIVSWGVYLGALGARLPSGWRERRAAGVTAAAFLVSVGVFLTLRITAGDSPFFL